MGLLDGQAVVITGSGRGLGRAFAIAVARAGAAVVVNDIDVDEAKGVVDDIERDGGRAVASGASVADWDSSAELIETCVTEFGQLDGLINNAVAYSYFGPPWEETGDQIRQQLEVNLMGSLFCGAHAMRHMRERRSGAIINITSRAMLGVPGMSTYSTTKGALASTTYSWAIEMAPYGVRVNALAPGAMTRAHVMSGQFGAHAQNMAQSPDLVAPAVVFLLSNLATDLNGQMLVMLANRLSIMRHPTIVEHVEERPEWTAETINEAFDEVYREHLQHVGIVSDS